MHGVWDSWRRSVPTNPPLFKQQGHIQVKQEERIRAWENKEIHTRSKKRDKTGGKLKKEN